MKKWLLLLICSLFGVSLSGCSLQNVVESVSPSREETPQDIHPDSTRVYMDEIQGTLQTFTGNKLTLTSSSQVTPSMFLRLRWNPWTAWYGEIPSA